MPRSVLLSLAFVVALLCGCNGAALVAPTAGPAAATTAAVVLPVGFRGATISVAQLPVEARETLRLIEQGGPYPYSQDDGVFSNREGILPSRARGYYHEYTVVTPRSPDRGARRLVVGGAGERYYTDDHYDSFRFVVDR